MNKKFLTKITVAVTLTLLMASVMLLPKSVTVEAQLYTNLRSGAGQPLPAGVTPDVTLDSLARLSFAPNPVGVGQRIIINLWVSPYSFGTRWLEGLKVTLQSPTGTDTVLTATAPGSDYTAYLTYVPDEVGTWKIKFDFAGAYWPAGNYTYMTGTPIGQGYVHSVEESLYLKPSTSGWYDLVVQEEPVSSWPSVALPTDYWTRPASPENREWAQIIGFYPSTGIYGGDNSKWANNTNYYMSNYRYIPIVTGPNTAHIVWSRQDALGGLLGDEFGVKSYTSSGSSPSIVYAGRCYQTVTKVFNGVRQAVWQCYDLRTGEIIWERTDVSQIPTMITTEYGYPDISQSSGGFYTQEIGGVRGAYLTFVGSGRYIAYQPWDGAVYKNYSIAPLTTGTLYKCTTLPFFLSVQNIGNTTNPNYRLINWTVAGWFSDMSSIADIQLRVFNNISWPFSSVPSTTDYQAEVSVSTVALYRAATGDPNNSTFERNSTTRRAGQGVPINYLIMGADLRTGALLYNHTMDVSFPFISGSTAVCDHGKFAVKFEDGYFHCWNARTGQADWVSPLSSYPWGIFPAYSVSSAYGNIYEGQYDGVAAYSWDDGKVVWLYKAPAEYPLESVYQSNYPFFTSVTIADGKIYAYNGEHSTTQPITRGWGLHCIDAYTGEGIWNITGGMSPSVVHDGYLTAGSQYDGSMYVFGKGQSATTVSAPLTAVTQGQSVMITGTVTDQSPAQPGAACVSKESMTTWMQYLHMQRPIPAGYTVIGVPVSINTLDPNGNWVHVADVTTDASGTFSYMFTPRDTGKYIVTAAFYGDDSYGSSSAQTAVGVVEAPAATPTPTPGPEAAPDTTYTIIGVGIAIIIAVVIATILILRKRP